MFNKKYKEDNRMVVPDANRVEELAKKACAKKTGSARGFGYKPALACMLAVAVVATTLILTLPKSGNTLPMTAANPAETVTVASAYDEVYTAVRGLQDVQNRYRTVDEAQAVAPEAVTSGSADAAKGETTAATADTNAGDFGYSDTNAQVEGVREADVAVTDGKYLYALSGSYNAGSSIRILEASGASTRVVSSIQLGDGGSNGSTAVNGSFYYGDNPQLYIVGDRLVLITQAYKNAAQPRTADGAATGDMYYVQPGESTTCIAVFDVSDRENPIYVNSLAQSGGLLSTRVIDNYLYTVSRHWVYDEAQRDQPQTYVPSTYVGEAQGHVLSASDLCLLPQPASAEYVVVTGLDITSPTGFVSNKAVLGSGDNLYCSQSAAYVAGGRWADGEDYGKAYTDIVKFSLAQGQVELCASGSVPGSVLNQFCMDEYQGNLRIVTTTEGVVAIAEAVVGEEISGQQSASAAAVQQGQSTTGLYVLDGQLNPLGAVENLAPGERVYSARFDGPTAYFVTFRQVDPLFSVDLSDAANPVVKSALKLPGFSEYLHLYSDGRLLGIGQDADENTGRTQGLKLTMFDTHNLADVTVAQTALLGEEFISTQVSYDHKAALVDGAKDIIGFPADSAYNSYYLVYGYSDATGFVQKAKLALTRADDSVYYAVRGWYIGNALYVYNGSTVAVYDMANSFAQLGSVDLTA